MKPLTLSTEGEGGMVASNPLEESIKPAAYS